MPPTLEAAATTASRVTEKANTGTLPVHSDGSQGLLAGGSEGDRGAGGGQGGPKGEPRRPPLEPLHLHGQHAHACWASSLTANLCLPQRTGRSIEVRAGPWSSSASDPCMPGPTFAHAVVAISADSMSERPGHLCPENVAHEVPPARFCACIKF